MTFTSAPDVILSDLNRSDGSAAYSYHGYSVIGSVNGPIEAQRRNELPEEALIDVIVRPAVGVGGRISPLSDFWERMTDSVSGVRERHIESILRTLLGQVILVQNHPRTLVQITLQFTGSPRDEGAIKPAQGGTVSPEVLLLLRSSIGYRRSCTDMTLDRFCDTYRPSFKPLSSRCCPPPFLSRLRFSPL